MRGVVWIEIKDSLFVALEEVLLVCTCVEHGRAVIAKRAVLALVHPRVPEALRLRADLDVDELEFSQAFVLGHLSPVKHGFLLSCGLRDILPHLVKSLRLLASVLFLGEEFFVTRGHDRHLVLDNGVHLANREVYSSSEHILVVDEQPLG